MNAATRKLLSEQLREAIERSELSRAEIGRQSGVDGASISRFMNQERSLSVDAVERLMQLFGLQVVEKKKRRR